MNRLVKDREISRVDPPPPSSLPPTEVQSGPQNHVWYQLQGRWYPISRHMAKGKGYKFQDHPPGPDEVRCSDWQRRIDHINGN